MLIEYNEVVETFDCLRRDAFGRVKKAEDLIEIIEQAARMTGCNDNVFHALRCDFMPDLIRNAIASKKVSRVADVNFQCLFLRVDVHYQDIRVVAAVLPAECKELMSALYPIYGKRRQAEGSGIGISLGVALDALDSFNVDDGDLRTATFAYAKERLATVDTSDARKTAAVELVSYINALAAV